MPCGVCVSTTCFTDFEVLLSKLASPPYSAAITSVPTGSFEVLNRATPPLIEAVPSTVVPCMKVTLSPFGGGTSKAELTVAVKVTGSPLVDGLGDVESLTVVNTPSAVVFMQAGPSPD